MKKKIKYKEGGICPKCKKGRIALATTYVSSFEYDEEPYNAGEKSKISGEITEINGSVGVIIHKCDTCHEVMDTWTSDMTEYKLIKRV